MRLGWRVIAAAPTVGATAAEKSCDDNVPNAKAMSGQVRARVREIKKGMRQTSSSSSSSLSSAGAVRL